MSEENPGKAKKHIRLGQWFATAICGNDILSSTFYVSGISILYAGIYAPIVLAFIGVVLFFYKSVYTEVVEALPTNGGAYNCLLNATSKNLAAIAGTTTILSYIATAVISGESAMQYLSSLFPVPVIPLTIALLFLFAILVISGIKDSAKVAFGIFSFHVIVLIAFVILGIIYYFHSGTSYIMQNFQATMPLTERLGGLIPALFFGFSASLLGVSGFESSANFVEEQQRGVFRKTLRNMLIGVAIFNPLIALVSLNTLPFADIIRDKDFLLSNVASIIGSPIFKYIVVIDAVLVLAGAVLTAFVGVSGLIYRMTTDGCFPEALAKQNSKGSYPVILILFFFLCSSILLMTKGNLLSLAGVYTIAFLTVMTMFAFGNMLMRETRHDLKRTYSAPIIFVVLAFIATAAGIIGNIKLDPQNLMYFISYFIPSMILVAMMLNLDIVYKLLLRFTHKLQQIDKAMENKFLDLSKDSFVVFVNHLNRLYEVLSYIETNETGRHVYVIHCNNGTKESDQKYAELQKLLPELQKAGAFSNFVLDVVYKDKPFGPEVIDDVSKEFKVRKNRILIGSIHHGQPFDYDDLGGVRIIF
jgi:amino acid transporter